MLMSKLFGFFYRKKNCSFFLNRISEWKSGHHPFPEMTRFLNSYSRIHYQSLKKPSASRTAYSLLEYICR